MGACGNVCCVAAVVNYSGFLSLGVLKYVVFSFCIVTRGAVGARVWEVCAYHYVVCHCHVRR